MDNTKQDRYCCLLSWDAADPSSIFNVMFCMVAKVTMADDESGQQQPEANKRLGVIRKNVPGAVPHCL